MAKTSLEIDRALLRRAASILGTSGVRDTVHAALDDVVNAKRRLELIDLFSQEGRFDWSGTEQSWGGDDE